MSAETPDGARRAGQPPKVIIFDLDGTLVDTMKLFADCAADLIATHFGIPPDVARTAYLRSSGRPFAEQLQLMFPGRDGCPIVAEAFEAFKREAVKTCRMSVATAAAVIKIRERGIRVAISSSSPRWMVEAFAWASPAVFDLALGYDERQARGKPHFDEIAEFFGCSNPDMLFVGDSLFDAEIATRHGVPFIALTGTLSQVDFVSAYPKIRCISDIADIVEMTAAR